MAAEPRNGSVSNRSWYLSMPVIVAQSAGMSRELSTALSPTADALADLELMAAICPGIGDHKFKIDGVFCAGVMLVPNGCRRYRRAHDQVASVDPRGPPTRRWRSDRRAVSRNRAMAPPSVANRHPSAARRGHAIDLDRAAVIG